MPKLVRFSACFLIFATSSAAVFVWAADPSNQVIEGMFYAGETGCDGGDTSKKCKVNIQLRGTLARFLYDHMQSDPDADPCVDGFGKSDKALYCSKTNDGQYQCHVGYDFGREELVRSDVTC